MKKILVLVFNHLRTDVRVQRQIKSLSQDYEITVACFEGLPWSSVRFHTLPVVRPGLLTKLRYAVASLLQLYTRAYWLLYDYRQEVSVLRLERFDAIIANDVETLPLAFYLKADESKVILDAHEYATRQFAESLRWRLFRKGMIESISRKYIGLVDGMTTQNPLFAREFEKEYGILPAVVANAPDYESLKPQPTDPGHIHLVHHGIYNTSRNLEKLIDVMDQVDERFSLDLFLHLPVVSNQKSRERFEHFKARASAHRKIVVHEPVAGEEVVRTIHRFDVGIHILEPISYNHAYSLPNKILEFVQARLGVVIGPSPGMVSIVEDHKVGVIAEDFSVGALAEIINSLTSETVDEYKENSENAAELLSSKESAKVTQRLVAMVLEPEDAS